jgi:hypothetical protein
MMQPKFEGHKIVRIKVLQDSLKVKVKDYGGNEATKDIHHYNGMAGRIINQIVGASMEWQIAQWFYDIEIKDGDKIYGVPERFLEEAT